MTALRLPAESFHDLAYRYPEVSVVLTELVADRLGEGTSDGVRGKRLDRYRIVMTIARGGMGVVYEATDEEDDGHPVALKMMSHRLLYKPGAAQRFQREAHVLLGLDHRNVARVLREFEAYKTYFIAMRLCRGSDLGHWIELARHDSQVVRCVPVRHRRRVAPEHAQGGWRRARPRTTGLAEESPRLPANTVYSQLPCIVC